MKSKIVKELVSNAELFHMELVTPDAEGNIPSGAEQYRDGYYYILHDNGLTDDEVKIGLLAKQTLYLKTIKNILVFSLVMWILGIIAGIILYTR